MGMFLLSLDEIDRECALEEATIRYLKGRIESLDSQLEEVAPISTRSERTHAGTKQQSAKDSRRLRDISCTRLAGRTG